MSASDDGGRVKFSCGVQAGCPAQIWNAHYTEWQEVAKVVISASHGEAKVMATSCSYCGRVVVAAHS